MRRSNAHAYTFNFGTTLNLAVVSVTAALYFHSRLREQESGNFANIRAISQVFGDAATPALLLPAMLVVSVLIALVARRISSNQKTDHLLSILAIFLTVAAIASKTPLSDQPGLWAGFGRIPALTTSAIVLFAFLQGTVLRSKLSLPVRLRLIHQFSAAALLVWYLPIYIQPPNGLINFGDTSYHVVDELLAPAMGAYSYANYSPQYTGMLGWIVAPFMWLPISVETKMTLVIVVINLFILAIPVLVLTILRLQISRLPKLLTTAAFVAVWTVTGAERGYSVHFREFMVFARVVPVLVSLLALVSMLRSSSRSQELRSTIAGILCGVSFLNSLDSGAPWSIIVVVVLLIATILRIISWRVFWRFVIGLSTSLVSYCLFLVTNGLSPSVSSFVGLRIVGREIYGGGIPSVTGPHVLVMSIAVASIAFGLGIFQARGRATGRVNSQVVALALGLWMFALLLKYLLFAHPVGLPIFFAPAFIVTVIMALDSHSPTIVRQRLTNRLAALPLSFLLFLPVGAVWQAPDFRDELRRISGQHLGTTDWSSVPGRVSDGWSLKALTAYDNVLRNVATVADELQVAGLSPGYFGIFGHTVELATGVDNVLGIPAPESLRFGDSQERLACIPVNVRRPDVIIVYASSFPCPGYGPVEYRSTDSLMLYRRIQKT